MALRFVKTPTVLEKLVNSDNWQIFSLAFTYRVIDSKKKKNK